MPCWSTLYSSDQDDGSRDSAGRCARICKGRLEDVPHKHKGRLTTSADSTVRTGVVISFRASNRTLFFSMSSRSNSNPLFQFLSPANPGAPVGAVNGCDANGDPCVTLISVPCLCEGSVVGSVVAVCGALAKSACGCMLGIVSVVGEEVGEACAGDGREDERRVDIQLRESVEDDGGDGRVRWGGGTEPVRGGDDECAAIIEVLLTSMGRVAFSLREGCRDERGSGTSSPRSISEWS